MWHNILKVNTKENILFVKNVTVESSHDIESVCMASHAFFESHFGFVDSGGLRGWPTKLYFEDYTSL